VGEVGDKVLRILMEGSALASTREKFTQACYKCMFKLASIGISNELLLLLREEIFQWGRDEVKKLSWKISILAPTLPLDNSRGDLVKMAAPQVIIHCKAVIGRFINDDKRNSKDPIQRYPPPNFYPEDWNLTSSSLGGWGNEGLYCKRPSSF
jgi:hypothetical protein